MKQYNAGPVNGEVIHRGLNYTYNGATRSRLKDGITSHRVDLKIYFSS